MPESDRSDRSDSHNNHNNLTDKFKTWQKKFAHRIIRYFFKKRLKTSQQLLSILEEANQHDVLSLEALNMIEGVLQVSDMQARDIMVPRSQMVVLDIDSPIEEVLPQMIESGHSRFPVIGEDRDEVLGTILAKDLLPFILQKDKKINIKELLRPAMVIPESKRLNILLKEFRLNRHHMAIIANEYGGISGLLTIEDILEQIVGDIEDEFDPHEENNIIKISENVYHVQALTPILEFNEYFNTDLDDTEFDTIGGVVLNSFGHMPSKNESLVIDGYKIKILNADKRRIRLLKISKVKSGNSNSASPINQDVKIN
ncbi:MAG: CBS domain-containing protein [Gammaproteobacteria bacterium]|nr:CBS domain-containing protein [Gammaproteobacteria bacterium]